ncbi:MAG: hypothetical protein DI527_16435 [Chelatococcus sp.]|nr:MAG: hypothetical protein DI527_16435 [Chelatococcus sp.]
MNIGGVDISMLQQAVESFGGLKTIQDTLTIAKQAKELFGKSKDGKALDPAAAQARELLVEMAEKMVSAREETATLRLQMLEILHELSRLQAFECDREKYDLVETAPGNFAYKAKGPVRGDHQAIRYCAHCFEQSKRLVTLQLSKLDFNRDTLQCSLCKGEIFQANNNKMEVRVGQANTRWSLDDY